MNLHFGETIDAFPVSGSGGGTRGRQRRILLTFYAARLPRQAGSGPLKGLEEQTHRPLDLDIRIEDDTIVRVMHKADGYHLLEFAAARTDNLEAKQLVLNGVLRDVELCGFDDHKG